MITEKSLPALPPNVIPNNAFSNDRVDPESDTPTELSPRPRQGHRHAESSSRSSSRPGARSPERHAKPEGLGLSSVSHRSNRSSTMMSNETGGEDGFFIPVALDPSPGPSSNSRSGSGNVGDASKRKDYFSPPKSQSSTPHIAFQDKGRQHSSDYGVQPGSLSRNLSRKSKQDDQSPMAEDKPPRAPPRPPRAAEDFQLQEAPQTRKPTIPSSGSSPYESAPGSAGRDATPQSESRKANENMPPRRSQDSRRQDQEETRQSLDSASRSGARTEANKATIARKELPSGGKNGT
jgi:hypothetical protein